MSYPARAEGLVNMINRYGDNLSPCKTLVTVSMKLVSPSDEWTIVFIFLWSVIIAVTVSLGRSFASSNCSIFTLYMESNTWEKSTNNKVASRFFAHTSSVIWWIVWICQVMDLFLQKLFWFFLRIFSISGLIWLRSRIL